MKPAKSKYEPYYGPIGSQIRLDRFCAATAQATLKFFEQPGIQEEFEAWREEYRRTGKIFNSKFKSRKCQN